MSVKPSPCCPKNVCSNKVPVCSFTILSASTAFRMLRSSLFLELFPTGASGILKQVKLGLIFLEERFSDATIFSQIKFDRSFAFLLGRKFVCPSLHLWNDVVGKEYIEFLKRFHAFNMFGIYLMPYVHFFLESFPVSTPTFHQLKFLRGMLRVGFGSFVSQLYCIIKKFLPLKYCLILFFAGSAGCKVNYVKACVSGGGGCLRTSAVQRKFVRLTILLRIRTWWNQGLFYWYEEWFISDIIQLCYEIQEICFEISTKFFSTFPEFTSRQSKNQGRRKNKIFIKRKKINNS